MNITKLKPWLRLSGRVGVALLLGLAIWNPGWRTTFLPINTIIVLDESQSMGDSTPDSAWQVSTTNIAHLPPGSRYSLIRFGADALLESASRANTELARQPERPHKASLDSTGTNIEAALRLAAQQLDPRQQDPNRQVGGTQELMILVTDGGETAGDATSLLSSFQAMGLPVPYLLLDVTTTSGPDAAIDSLEAPSRVPFGAEITVAVEVSSNRTGPAGIEVRKDGEPAITIEVNLIEEQVSSVFVPLGFDSPGFQEIEVAVSMRGDTNPANDRRRAIVNVDGPTTIVYVTARPGTTVTESLLAGGWNLNIVRPEHFPQVLSLLSSPAAVVLDDVAIGDLPENVWTALTESVRTRGTGLIVLGGQHSFGAGGYLNSTLESSLPVTSEAGTPMSRAAVLFVVDKSGSMGRGSGDVTAFGLAKTAVLTATSLLGEHDLSGIIAFDIDPETWLPLADRDEPATSIMEAWQDAPSGGTSIAPALMAAAEQLRVAEVDQRLLVLVTDGFAVEDDYTDVLDRIDDYKIDVIALAIGDEPGINFLEALTSRNDGLLLRVSDVAMLPRLASEAVGSRRLTYDSKVTRPRQVRQLPFLAEDDISWPELNGYMVTKERLDARVYLRSERGDPLLADRDFGLGRVVVLPGGLGSYASTWPNWPAWAPFIGGSMEWASNRFSDDSLFIRVTEEHARPQLEIDAVAIDGNWETIDTARVSLSDPLGLVTVLNVQAVAPGKYRVELPLKHTGHYRASVRVGSVSKPHDFFYDAPAELNAGSLGAQITTNWLKKELVRPWRAADSMRTRGLASNQPTRSFFITMAALLYLGILLTTHAYVLQNWRKRLSGFSSIH